MPDDALAAAPLRRSAELRWSEIRYAVHPRSKKQKLVLDGVSGALPPSTLLAILGPSGSGKTSLLNVLANRVPHSTKALLTGSVMYGDTPHHRIRSAYVMQEESLFELATVRETLMFTAMLRMPQGTTLERMQGRVQEVVNELNLSKCMDTIIGNVKIRGVSGGERKRLGIGIELLNDPSLVFMDEPTSGLDSFQAAAVMSTLATLAKHGRTVVASIHQPRSSIYSMLGSILLMSSGRVAYFGASGREAEEYFASIDLPVPPSFNPADHFVDVVSFDARKEELAEATNKRINLILDTWEQRHCIKMGVELAPTSAADDLEREMPFWSQVRRDIVAFRLLLARSWQENTRNSAALIFKYTMNAFFVALFGLVYFQLDRTQTSIQNRNGVLFFMSMNQAFASVISTAEMIPRQLQVVLRERAAKMYGVAPFYWATWCVAIPLEMLPQLLFSCIQYFLMNLRNGADHFFIFTGLLILEAQCAIALGMVLSALITEPTAAAQVAPAAVILFLIFSGYLLNEESVPDWLSWLKYISFIRYTYQALTVNEFEGAAFTCKFSDGSNSTFCLSGDDWIRSLNFSQVTISANIGYILALTGAFHVLAFYFVLVLRRPRFLKFSTVSKGTRASMNGGSAKRVDNCKGPEVVVVQSTVAT